MENKKKEEKPIRGGKITFDRFLFPFSTFSTLEAILTFSNAFLPALLSLLKKGISGKNVKRWIIIPSRIPVTVIMILQPSFQLSLAHFDIGSKHQKPKHTFHS